MNSLFLMLLFCGVLSVCYAGRFYGFSGHRSGHPWGYHHRHDYHHPYHRPHWGGHHDWSGSKDWWGSKQGSSDHKVDSSVHLGDWSDHKDDWPGHKDWFSHSGDWSGHKGDWSGYKDWFSHSGDWSGHKGDWPDHKDWFGHKDWSEGSGSKEDVSGSKESNSGLKGDKSGHKDDAGLKPVAGSKEDASRPENGSGFKEPLASVPNLDESVPKLETPGFQEHSGLKVDGQDSNGDVSSSIGGGLGSNENQGVIGDGTVIIGGGLGSNGDKKGSISDGIGPTEEEAGSIGNVPASIEDGSVFITGGPSSNQDRLSTVERTTGSNGNVLSSIGDIFAFTGNGDLNRDGPVSNDRVGPNANGMSTNKDGVSSIGEVVGFIGSEPVSNGDGLVSNEQGSNTNGQDSNADEQVFIGNGPSFIGNGPSTIVERPDINVNGPGTIVDRPDINGNGPSTIVDRPDINGNGPSTIVDRPDINGNRPGSIVDRPDINGNGPSTIVDRPYINVNGPDTVVDRPDINGNGPNTIVDRPDINGNGPGSIADRPDINGNGPSTIVDRPDINGNGAGSIVDRADINENGPSTIVDRPYINVNGPGTIVDRPDINGNGTNTIVDRPDINANGPGTIVDRPDIKGNGPSTIVGRPDIIGNDQGSNAEGSGATIDWSIVEQEQNSESKGDAPGSTRVGPPDDKVISDELSIFVIQPEGSGDAPDTPEQQFGFSLPTPLKRETTLAPIDAQNNRSQNKPTRDHLFSNNSIYNKGGNLGNVGQGSPGTPSAQVDNRQGAAGGTENACAAFDVEVPDFKSPLRRISESKCYEYVWLLKNRADKEETEPACIEQRKRNGDSFISVVGGHEVEVGEYPHMAAIGWEAPPPGTWVFKCGGSLISPKWVLTAAHCIKTSLLDTSVSDPVPKIVRLGDKNILDRTSDGSSALDVYIARILSHPSYVPPKKYFDIALMELQSNVEFTKLVQPACLWSKPSTAELGNRANLTGWGVIATASLKTSPELLAAEVDLITSQRCDQLLRPSCNRLWCGIQDHQVCAGQLTGGIDACKGDSGGPLQVKIKLPIKTQGQLSYIIGVTSFGIGCARANTPGVYTRVSTFIDWIESTVWP